MGRTQQVVETITCDLCGRPAQGELSVMLGWDGEQWRVDLCPADYKRVASQFDQWISNSESVPAAKPRIEVWAEADVPWLGSGKPDKRAIRERLLEAGR